MLKHLSAFVKSQRFSGFRAGILIAMCVGLILPALIGGKIFADLRLNQVNQEMDRHLEGITKLLANSLANPAWNYDLNTTKAIAEASLLDPQVVRITITIGDPSQPPFVNIEQPERRLGKQRVKRERLALAKDEVGFVELEMDDGPMNRGFQQDRQAYFLLLLGQFLLAFALILTAIRFWVLKPLARLTGFSSRIANGDLEHAIDWQQSDEIGQLAQQLDQMRNSLCSSFAEQRAILSNIQVGVIFERDNTIQLANRHAEQIFGYAPDEMRGCSTRIIYPSDEQYLATRERVYLAIATPDGRYEEELCMQHRSGHTFWAQMRGCALDSRTPKAGSIWVFDDITARKSAESEINNLAFYDPLTGLPNRRLLLDRLKHALASNARNESDGALLFIDLDNFKMLNDTLGHDIGDVLLKEVAERLITCIRDNDTVARLGGDEFVLMLEGLSKSRTVAAAQVKGIGEKIINVLNQPYLLAGYEHQSTPSIGITLFADLGECENPVDSLLKQADLAMYQAKAGGRNTMRFFDQEMQAAVTMRAALEAGLREAVLKDQFLLYYQAQVDKTGRLTGVEALVRWQHPLRGLVSPLEFIPLAEDTGLIMPLGLWVLKTACTQLAMWASRPETSHLTVSVNISARQIHHGDFVAQVLSVLEETGASPDRLKLELTESLLVDDVEDTIAKMRTLKAAGVCFSLDDFGTGYSSLSYLKRLPLNQLKIDRSFVKDVLTDANDASIARMIVVLAESLGLSVIAEGVETEEQRELLARQGCHFYQGYLFGYPTPLIDLEAKLARDHQPGAVSSH